MGEAQNAFSRQQISTCISKVSLNTNLSFHAFILSDGGGGGAGWVLGVWGRWGGGVWGGGVGLCGGGGAWGAWSDI